MMLKPNRQADSVRDDAAAASIVLLGRARRNLAFFIWNLVLPSGGRA